MRYLITFSYDGSKFNGYQKQPLKKTVQGEIEEALKKINGSKSVLIHASGRTDAGVHAYNQKAHFDLDINMNLNKLKQSLNSLTDDAIYIKNIEKIDDTFHARFNVKAKQYIYKINMGEYNPIEKDYVYQYCKKLNLKKIKKAAKYLKGTHDFKSFSKADKEKEDFVRTIIKVQVIEDKKNPNLVTLSFLGTGFLRYQVRNMVGLLLDVGSDKKTCKDVLKILNSCDRTKSSITASPVGLYLNDVFYK